MNTRLKNSAKSILKSKKKKPENTMTAKKYLKNIIMKTCKNLEPEI